MKAAINRRVDARRQQRLTGGDDAHGADQLGRFGVLDEEPAGAGAQRLVHVLVELERREHEHPDAFQLSVLGDLSRRGEPVDVGHADVHQHDVGPLRGG